MEFYRKSGDEIPDAGKYASPLDRFFILGVLERLQMYDKMEFYLVIKTNQRKITRITRTGRSHPHRRMNPRTHPSCMA